MTASPAAVSAPATPAGASLRAVPRALWVALGVLALATAGLAGALVTRMAATPAAPAAAAVTAPADAALAATAQALAPAATPSPAVAPQPAPAPVVAAPAPARAPARSPAPARSTTHASAAPAPYEPAPVAQPVPVARVAICATCGTVESVRAIEQQAEGSGLGAIAGGVLGGLAGHQVGGGTGKKVMTVLGAVGGGYAGNEVEKRMRAVKAYDVSVRMEDGSIRTVRQSEAVAPGTPVVVEGGVLRVVPARSGGYDNPAPRTLRTSAPA